VDGWMGEDQKLVAKGRNGGGLEMIKWRSRLYSVEWIRETEMKGKM